MWCALASCAKTACLAIEIRFLRYRDSINDLGFFHVTWDLSVTTDDFVPSGV